MTQTGALKPFHGIGSNNTGGVVFKACEVCGKIMPDSDDMAIREWVILFIPVPEYGGTTRAYYCPEHKDDV